MSDGTKIEWTDATWNVVNGCSLKSPGCEHCYAMRLAATRLRHHPSRAGLARIHNGHPQWTGEVRFNDKVLLDPLRWRRPRRIFVCAHGDLFHENVPDEWIDRVFAVMALCPQHTFQVLTKRPERMRDYVSALVDTFHASPDSMDERFADLCVELTSSPCAAGAFEEIDWPLPNVWLGTSVEDQKRADERIPILLDTPAAVHWISAEPLLGPIDLRRLSQHVDQVRGGHPGGDDRYDACVVWIDALTGELIGTDRSANGELHNACVDGRYDSRPDWVVVGGESGRVARPMHPDWARSLRDQCAAAGVAFLFKQWGEFGPCESQNGTAIAGEMPMMKIGKKAAGRLLDGVQHDGYPA